MKISQLVMLGSLLLISCNSFAYRDVVCATDRSSFVQASTALNKKLDGYSFTTASAPAMQIDRDGYTICVSVNSNQ